MSEPRTEACPVCGRRPNQRMRERLAALPVPALAQQETDHQHTPTSKRGDTNAYCSTCGYFPLALPVPALDQQETDHE